MLRQNQSAEAGGDGAQDELNRVNSQVQSLLYKISQ